MLSNNINYIIYYINYITPQQKTYSTKKKCFNKKNRVFTSYIVIILCV